MTEQVTTTTAEVVKRLAFDAAEPTEVYGGNIYTYMGDGRLHTLDLTGDQYLEFPKRKRGTVTVRNVASFAHYYAKHATADSEVYADLDAGTFTAVLDAHGSDTEDVRWQQHRLVLQLQHTHPWETWHAEDRHMMPQQEFAEFLEDNARDVAPNGRVTAADLLEVAQHFQANTKVNFTSGQRLATGQTQFTYTEEVDAKAGKRGTIEIPAEFDLAIVPYEDCKPKIMAARFRYRLANGELRLGYFLNDPARTAREACEEIAGKLADVLGNDTVIMHGQPARS
jgi:uncharacterized protein YfdQ (DUF2303 family)